MIQLGLKSRHVTAFGQIDGKWSAEFGPFYMGVSKNRGTPKSSILIGFSIINHPFWGTPVFGNTNMGWVFHF